MPSTPSEPECERCNGNGYEPVAAIDGIRYAQCEGCDYWSTWKQKRLDHLFQQSGVPDHFEDHTLMNYPGSAATAERVRQWVVDEDHTEKFSLLLYGKYGVGKTGLAVGALRLWQELHHSAALFMTVPALLDAIRSSYDHAAGGPTETKIMSQAKDVDLLVLDDLGAERATDWVQEKLFTLVNHRHDWHLATIFTSNLAPKALAGHIGERTAWRIMEMAECLAVDGPNLRAAP